MSEQEPLDLKAIEERLSKLDVSSDEFIDLSTHLSLSWDDIQFVANAPTDIAALVAEIKRLRAGLATIANWYEDSGDMYEEIMMPKVVALAEALLTNTADKGYIN